MNEKINMNLLPKNPPFVSFVVPMFNEEECISELYSRITAVCINNKVDFEIICIDDGSRDRSLWWLKKLNKKDNRVKIISFSRNFGHQIGVIAGLRYSHGDCVVVMDADLQDPPELLSKMLAKWYLGYKVIYGIRKSRKERFLKRLCYKIFYRLLFLISSLYIPLDAGDFCLMDRKVVDELNKFSEDRPFVRGLRSWIGFKQIGLEYDRDVRKAGESKYDLMQLFKLALDGLFSFSNVILKSAGWAGLIISFFSFIYGLYIAAIRILSFFGLYHSKNIIPGWATLVVSITFLIGLQFIFMGILGEYIGRIFLQVKQRPLFVIEEEIGFNKKRKKSGK